MPVEESRAVWRCPICSKMFDMRQYCEAHMEYQHPEPTPEALALVGSYLGFKEGDSKYIMKAERVEGGSRVSGPAVSLKWDGTVDFDKYYWILSDAVEHTVIDGDEAGQVWKGWCADFADRLLKRADVAWGLMLGKEGEA